MKKVVRILLAILMVTCLALGITACKSECEKGNHDKYIKSTDEATCTTAEVEHWACHNCDDWTDDVTKGEPLGHDFDAWKPCTDNDAQHQRACKRDGCTVVEKANHAYVDGICVCGKTEGVSHVCDFESQPWKVDAASGKHYQECKDPECNLRNEHAARMTAYAVSGEKHEHHCTVKGCTISEDHDISMSAWAVDGNNHERHCTATGCAIKETHVAAMSAWTPCDDDSKHEKTCGHEGCSIKETANHVFVKDVAQSVAPKCEEDGYDYMACVCGSHHNDTVGKLGHDFQTTNWTTGDGKHWHECRRAGCDARIDEAAHTYDSDEALRCNVCHNPKEGVNFVLSYGSGENLVELAFDYLYEAVAYATNEVTLGTPVLIEMGTIDGSTTRESTGIKIGLDKNGNAVTGLNLTINFKGKNYQIARNPVGSSGTETNGFQILQGNTVKLMNGTISVKEGISDSVIILIQNYSDLTLDNINIDGTNLTVPSKGYSYALSNNCGNVTLTNAVHVTAAKEKGVALDVWYNMGGRYPQGVHVTVGSKSTISGVIEYGSAQANVADLASKAVLELPELTAGEYQIRYSGNITDCANVGITIGGVKISHRLGDWQSDGTNHWKVCSLCNKELEKANHSITYTIEGDKHIAECSVCGYKSEPVAHTYDNGLCVCGKMHTEFPVSEYNDIIASVPNQDDNSDEKLFAVGVVKSIKDDFNSTIIISDEEGNLLQIYGVFNFDGTVRNQKPSNTYSVGDLVVYYGIANNYGGTAQLKNAWLVQLGDTAYITVDELVLLQLVIPQSTNKDFELPQVNGLVWSVKSGTSITIENNIAKVINSATESSTVVLTATLNGKTRDFTVEIPQYIPGEAFVFLTKENLGLGSYPTDEVYATVAGVEYALFKVGNYDGSIIQMQNNKDYQGYINNKTAFAGRIVRIELVYASGKTVNNGNLTVGFGSANGTYAENHTVNYTDRKAVIEAEANYCYFKLACVSGKNAVYLDSIKIVYRDCEHQIVSKEAKEATCGVPGYAAHYECSICGDWFSDAQGANPIKKEYVIIQHTFVNAANHHEAVAAKCEQDGNIEYYVCDVCGHYFKADKTTEIELSDTVLEAIGHDYEGVAYVDDGNGTSHSRVCKNDGCGHKDTQDHSTAKEAWEIGADEHYRICEVCTAHFDIHSHDFTNGDCICGAKDVVRRTVTFTVGEGAKVIKASDPDEATGLTSMAIEDGTACEFRIVVTDGYTLGDVKKEGQTEPLVAGDNGIYRIENVTADIAVTVNVTKNEPVLVYTLDTSAKAGSNNSYTGNCDIKVGDITWNVVGNSTMAPWRIGGKSLSGVDRSLTSKTAISQNISKVVVNFGNNSGSITVNSVTFKVYNADPTSGAPAAIHSATLTYAANDSATIEKPADQDWSNCYYQVTFNLSVSGTSNKYVTINTVEFYK